MTKNGDATRPIVWALFFLVTGILFGMYLPGIVGLIVLMVLSFCVCIAYERLTEYKPIFICVIVALFSFIRVQESMNVGVISADNVELMGIVQDMSYTAAGWQRLEVDLLEAIYSDEMLVAEAGMRLLTFLSPEYNVQMGQRVWLIGDLHRLERAANPGGYDEFMVQRPRGISGRFNARTVETFEITESLTRTAFIIRNRLAAVYSAVLPFREANLMQSIVLGERPDSNDRVVEMYRMAGIYHLMVVSGLHLSILMMVLYFLLEKVLNKRMAGLLALIFIIAYTILTGAGISTVRAATMAGVVVFGRILYRDQDALASVSFACMLLLLYEPLYLFSVGFQLSFGTVFGIVLLTKPTERALSKFLPPTAFRQLLAYNIVASVSTYPILAYYFSYISTYSILVNMIVAPTFVLLVVLGMVMGLIGLVSLGVASFLGGAVYYILQFYEFVAGFFLSLPGSIWLLGNWGLLVTVASLACMLAFGFMYSGFGEIFAKRAKIMVVVSVFLVTAIAFESLNRRNFNVTALDVGSYVVTYGSSSFVVNGGGNNRLLGMNTGATTIMPYLDRRGINTANAAFVTATNRQNIMGLIELAMQNRVTILYAPEWLDLSSGLGLRLQTEARRNNIDIQILALGDTVQLADMYFILTTEGLQLFYREHGFVF